MEIILLENILNLGNIGDKVNVKMVMEGIIFSNKEKLLDIVLKINN